MEDYKHKLFPDLSLTELIYHIHCFTFLEVPWLSWWQGRPKQPQLTTVCNQSLAPTGWTYHIQCHTALSYNPRILWPTSHPAPGSSHFVHMICDYLTLLNFTWLTGVYLHVERKIPTKIYLGQTLKFVAFVLSHQRQNINLINLLPYPAWQLNLPCVWLFSSKYASVPSKHFLGKSITY